ncbi:MAG: hypothetical protein AAB676_07125 [Verrucomicrobiota bacterium]
MRICGLNYKKAARRVLAFTLVEVVISTGIAAMTIGGIVYGYVLAAQRAELSSYMLAAQSLAMQRLEQSRAAKWDPMAYPVVDELVSTNFPQTVEVLDIPVSGTNIVYATNKVTVTTLSTNPPLKMIQADCTWSFMSRRLFTNTVVIYRTADQ